MIIWIERKTGKWSVDMVPNMSGFLFFPGNFEECDKSVFNCYRKMPLCVFVLNLFGVSYSLNVLLTDIF